MAALPCRFFVDQPLVTTGGGGALGDLPAQAARLSTLSDAKMKTSNFFMELPPFQYHSCGDYRGLFNFVG